MSAAAVRPHGLEPRSLLARASAAMTDLIARPEHEVPDRQLVLVVDDESSYRDALSSGLSNEGFSVVLAADGATAVEELLARTSSFALDGEVGRTIFHRRGVTSLPLRFERRESLS